MAPIKSLSLDSCLKIALENSNVLVQTKTQTEINKLALKQSLDNRLPSINSSISQYFSFGRTLDPFTNEYRQQNAYYNNFNLGASLMLYNGFQIKNTVEQNKLNIKASIEEANTLKFTKCVQIINAFLLVLNNEELLSVAEEQLKMSFSQFERVEKLFMIGSSPLSNLNELKVQIVNDKYTVMIAKNNILTAKLSLLQAMNIHNYPIENLKLDKTDFEQYSSIQTSLNQMDNVELSTKHPLILLNKTKIKALVLAVNVARGAFSPTISLTAGLGTSYSSLAPSEFPLYDAQNPIVKDTPSDDFVSINGNNFNVIRKTQSPNNYRKLNYFGQLDYNLNRYISFNLSIPIFDRFTVRNKISNAVLQVENAQSQLKIAEEQILNEIENLILQKNISKSKYESVEEQLKVIEDSYRFTQNRFNSGVINYIDFNLMKTSYEKIKVSLIQAKYDFLLKEKIYQLYQNGVK